MTFDTHHRIIGIKLVTLHGAELDLAPDIEWNLTLWRMSDWRSEKDREIETGTVIESVDPDFRETSQSPAPAPLRRSEGHASFPA